MYLFSVNGEKNPVSLQATYFISVFYLWKNVTSRTGSVDTYIREPHVL